MRMRIYAGHGRHPKHPEGTRDFAGRNGRASRAAPIDDLALRARRFAPRQANSACGSSAAFDSPRPAGRGGMSIAAHQNDEFFVRHGADLFDYDARTGSIRAREAPDHLFTSIHSARSYRAHVRVGSERGVVTSGGYKTVQFCGRRIMAHRLAWILQTGAAPFEVVDHINGDAQDNRWSNLRSVSQSMNLRNARLRKDNTSGCPGVFFTKRDRCWIARIKINRKEIHLGYFETKDRAVAARLAAQVKYGFTHRHGSAA